MKIAGIIAEYNPFHNGHAHHIRETRRRTGCDAVVVCMAGSFTQRGEAAVLSKGARVRAALLGGADAVFELPTLYAVRTADVFARGGVTILGQLGCDVLSFGCETQDMALLEALASDDDAQTHGEILREMKTGKTLPRARGAVLARRLGVEEELFCRPNLILGARYLRAMRDGGFSMKPFMVPRMGDYHDETMSTFSSATAIRKALREGRMEEACAAVPEETCALLRQAPKMHAPDDLALYTLRGMSAEEIRKLPDVREGLENRILRAAAQSATYAQMIENIKCKRYTHARLTRLAAHAMLRLDAPLAARHPFPEYARLLGMRESMRPLLTQLRERSRIPIVTRAAELRGDEVFRLECRAADLRALLCDAPEERLAGTEMTQKFITVNL